MGKDLGCCIGGHMVIWVHRRRMQGFIVAALLLALVELMDPNEQMSTGGNVLLICGSETGVCSDRT